MRIKHIFLILSLILSANLFAQHNEEVTIEGTYRPKVNKVDKILAVPETPKPSFEMPGTEIHTLDIEHHFPMELDKLTPVSYSWKNTRIPNAAKNFLMAGFGSRLSPVFLYKHNSNLTKNLGLGVGIKHYSSWLGIKDYAPSDFMNNAFDISLTSNGLSNLQVGGSVYYKYDMVRYYGVNTTEWTVSETTLAEMAPQQTYNTIGARFGLASTNTRNNEFVHDLSADYHCFFGKLGRGMEHFGRLDYDLGYVASWWGKKNYPQKIGIALGTEFDHTAFLGQAVDNRLIFKVNPYFEMRDDFYRLHLGVRMDGATMFKPSDGFLSVHPDLKGSLFVLDNTLEFYAGLNGGRKLCTYSDLAGENPFVGSALNMKVTTVKLGFEGGFRTNIMNTLDVHVGVRYRHTDNDWFYRQNLFTVYPITGDHPHNSYDVIYDETRQVSVLGNVRWLALDKLTVDAGVAYHSCKPVVEQRAWYRPELEGDLKLEYQFSEAFAMSTSFLYQGGRWAKDDMGTPFKLDDVYDLGLGADYKVQDQFTVFVKANNILNRKYSLYRGYPVSGIEFFAGLKMNF